MSDERIELDPASALHAMLESEGWALFMEHARGEYGSAAQNRKIRAALQGLPASEHSVVTQAILATADEVRALVAWPEEEMARLKEAPARQPVDRFAPHRLVTG